MTQPLPGASFTVVPDAVDALATELRSLAAELAEDGDRTRMVAASFLPALGGHEGWAAGAAATAWACVYEVVSARTTALGATLAGAAAAYRVEDAALAGRLPR
jgi:hypothetical protein